MTGRDLETYLANPQLLNSYSYALNNPLAYRDPDGNIPLPVIAGILWAYGWVDLGINAYDYKTIVLDHPDVFTPEQVNAAKDRMTLDLALMAIGGGVSKIGGSIGLEAKHLGSIFMDTLGIWLDVAESTLSPDENADSSNQKMPTSQEQRSTSASPSTQSSKANSTDMRPANSSNGRQMPAQPSQDADGLSGKDNRVKTKKSGR